MSDTLVSQAASPATSAATRYFSEVRVHVPAILSIAEVCELLTISRRACADLLGSKRLQSFKIGRRRLVRRADLEKLTGAKLA
jgi:excisionase family DNA binding protein